MQNEWINGLLGGGLIGAAAALLLLANGRIAGVSGIAGGLVDETARERLSQSLRGPLGENALFVLGLVASPLLYFALGGDIAIELAAGAPAIIAGGLLVGLGARLGSGCTSGHGVCGGARLSRRSFAAMAVFMSVAMAVVAIRGLM